jgi:hypothetical protein
MAISFVAAGTVGTGANATAGLPAGTTAGDVLIVTLAATTVPGAPTGWTAVASTGSMAVYYKIAGATETSLAFSGLSIGAKTAMVAYRGAGAYEVVPAITSGTSTTATPNTVTTTYANDYIVYCYICGGNIAGVSWTPNANTTARVNSASPVGGVGAGLLMADELKATAGVSTARAATLNRSVSWGAVPVAIIEARTVYWRGGTGTWSTTTTNWSNTSGGAGGAVAPSANDDVVVNGSSGSPTITLSGNIFAKTLTTTGATCTLTSTGTLAANGNITLSATTTWSATGTININNSSTITTNGVTIVGAITLNNSGATLTLGSALTLGSSGVFTITTGTLLLSTFTLSALRFVSTNAVTRSIQFGTGNITTTGSGTAFNVVGTSLTYTGTPTVNISNNSATATTVTATSFSSSNVFNFNITTGTYALTLTTASFFNALNFTGFTGTWAPGTATATFYGNLTLVSGMTLTTGSGIWTFAGTSGIQAITSAGKQPNPLEINNTGTSVQLQDNLTASNSLTLTRGTFDWNFKTINSGFASLTVSTGASTIINNAASATYTFSNTITINSGTLTLSSTAPLATSSSFSFLSGTLVLSNLTFNCASISSANSNTRSIQFGTGNITVTGSSTSFNVTGTNLTYTGTPTVNISPTSGNVTITAINFIETNAFNVNVTTGAGTFTLTADGVVKSLNFTGFTGTYPLGVNLTCYGSLTFVSGMLFNAGGRTITFANTSGTATITSAGQTLGGVTKSGAGGTLAIADATTLDTLTFTAGTLQLPASTTITVGSFVTTGTTLKFLTSSTSGTQATISDASGTNTVTYLSIQDSNATGGALWDASSATNVNAGNNSGWFGGAFGSPSNFFLLF